MHSIDFTVRPASPRAVFAKSGCRQAYQYWTLTFSDVNADSGSLLVQQDGSFTSWGFTGTTPNSTYTIDISGHMYGKAITLTQSAVYDNGNSQLYGTGEGTLNTDFPSATSASGLLRGTISSPSGNREYTLA